MRRIIIIGSPGSGKSTLSEKLSEKLCIPVTHLDKLWWKSGWVESTKEEFDQKLDAVLMEDKWIIDGNYSRTLEKRLQRADTVIFLDYPTLTCLYRVFKRVMKNRGKTRIDMAEGCPERFNFEFMRYVFSFRRKNRKKILSLLDKAEGKRIIIIRNNAELEKLI